MNNTQTNLILIILAIGLGFILGTCIKRIIHNWKTNKTMKLFIDNISEDKINKIIDSILPLLTKNNLGLYMDQQYDLYMDECKSYIKNNIIHSDNIKNMLFDDAQYTILNNIDSLEEISTMITDKIIESKEDVLKDIYYTNLHQNIMDSNRDAEAYEEFLQSFPDDDEDVKLHPAEVPEENTEADYYPSINQLVDMDTVEDIEDEQE